MKILAVDPGVATGWAEWDAGRVTRTGILQQQEFCTFAADWIWLSHVEDVVVCESYQITAGTTKMTFQPASLEIIGTLRWLCGVHHLKFELSPPAAKRFMPDGKLRALGWYVRGSEGHDNDALRHLGVYLGKQNNQEVLRARSS